MIIVPLIPFRRRRRFLPPPEVQALPTVLSVVVDTFNNTIDVTFSEAVTWDGEYSLYFMTDVGGAQWGAQLGPSVLRGLPQCGAIFAVGANWYWADADPTLSPTPDPMQTGVCT